MKHITIKSRDIPDAWFLAITHILDNGKKYEVTQGSYVGSFRYEFDSVAIQITHPHICPMLPEIPPDIGVPDPVPEGMDYIHKYLSTYLMDGIVQPNETYTYGSRLVGYKVIENKNISTPGASKNQIIEVISVLRNSHGTNQATMEIGLPNDIGTEDPPCLRLIDCKISEKKLHFFVYFRSWDLWGGFPANLAAIELLKQYIADEIGIDNGELFAYSKGLHIYDYAKNLVKLRLRK